MLKAECLGQYVTGNFSCVEGYIVLERKIWYYVMFVLIPSLLCVMTSWASFWINLQIAPARVTLSVATFLTISQQQATINQGTSEKIKLLLQ